MEAKYKNLAVGLIIVMVAVMVAVMLIWIVGRQNAAVIVECALYAGLIATFLGLRYRRPRWLHRNLRSAFRLDD